MKDRRSGRDDFCAGSRLPTVRTGWEEAFEAMRKAGDDYLEESGATDWDDTGWVWE